MRLLRTDNLVLEPQTREHAAEMLAVLRDPAIYTFIDDSPPASLEWLRARFERLESRSSPDGSKRWLNWVIRKPGGPLTGYVQATVHPDASAVIAYVLSPPFWGQGIAHEATSAMIRELVSQYATGTLFATVARENQRSLRLLERLGFSAIEPADYPHDEVVAGDVVLRWRKSSQ